MLAFDCEDIPPKEDTAATATTNTASTSNNENGSNVQTTTASNRWNAHFQQKTKFIRDIWTELPVAWNAEHSHFWFIIVVSFLSFACAIGAITTNHWTCDNTQHFGLWNTCFLPPTGLLHTTTLVIVAPVQNKWVTGWTSDINSTTTTTTIAPTIFTNKTGLMCAAQTIWGVVIDYVEQTRADQVMASQGLIVSGTILYFFSILALCFAYKWIKTSNLNCVRNALVTSMCVQIVSFFLTLVGFWLFIWTDRISTSTGLLFVYFGVAIFATNIINFLTIEYKSYKTRQISI